MLNTFVFPNKILFGPGSVEELPGQLKALQVRRPLLVTDRGLVKAGLAGHVQHLLALAGLQGPRFDEVDPNPTEENVLAGLGIYGSEGCDGIVGLGGGSALDVAKGIRLKVNHPLPLAEYALEAGGWNKITGPLPPLAAVPTTAGTGSETGRGALIIVRPSGAKVAVAGERFYASFSISDPDLTLDLPPFLTAGTGMDAFTHCVEEYLAPRFHPLVDGMALEGLRLASDNLVRAYRNGRDVEARGRMMIAALIGGIGFAKGLGIVHSLSHPIGSVVGGHHGTTNAILLPASLEFNFQAALPRFRILARAANIETAGLSDEECGRSFIAFVRSLNRELGIPRDLSAIGARREHIDRMLPLCLADHCHKTNPRPCTEEDFRRLLEAHIPG
ncbi:MAG: iron-containing alcohol dehydrogenase [Planctomycetes bacterium]|nr:iron-containing alcohol dehydrogenase [Planctomycetota bacterium]